MGHIENIIEWVDKRIIDMQMLDYDFFLILRFNDITFYNFNAKVLNKIEPEEGEFKKLKVYENYIFVIEGNNKIIAINISTYSEKTFTSNNKTIFDGIRFMDVYEYKTNINIVTSTNKEIYINPIPKKKFS